MSEQIFHIIGISDCNDLYLPPATQKVIAEGTVFSGGRRHHELMKPYLPKGRYGLILQFR